MPELKNSEYFSNVFYDIIAETLEIHIKGTAKKHVYEKVPEKVYMEFKESDDPDKYFKENIKKKYENQNPYS